MAFKYNNKLSRFVNHNHSGEANKGVYTIPCGGCDNFYIGETGRSLDIRKKEHIKDIEKRKLGSGIVEHSENMGHDFDFDKAKLVHLSKDINARHVMESALIMNNLNKCVNLNRGFSPHNYLFSKLLTSRVKIRLKCLNLYCLLFFTG